jgi:5-methylcytosine-specific restriction endonuclease McrA
MSNCIYCAKELVGYDQKKFCSKSCSASYNNKNVTRNKHGKNGHIVKKQYELILKKPRLTDRQKKRKNCERVMRYRARKYSQTPLDADLKLIKKIYENCPVGYEVDHIIPISRGGHHHQDNLQYLTRSQNASKGNKLNWTQ